jgi:hypothetical protein
MNPAYYMRTASGENVIRIGSDSITLQENDFSHSEWRLESSLLSADVVNRVHQFCGLNGISLNWTAMAKRCY